MTPDMAFECVLVSKDANVVSIMTKTLEDLAISTNVCPTREGAVDYLSEGATDLVIVDWQKDSSVLLHHITQSFFRKPVVMVVSDTASPTPEAQLFLRKPLSVSSSDQSLRQAYSKLLQEYREHTRCALVGSVIAKNQYDRSVPITLTNISAGGVGFSIQDKELLLRGDLLSFPVLLPGTEITIQVEGRVLWMREYGAAGCEFANIAHGDHCILEAWLEQKCHVKKPRVKIA